MLRRWMRRKLRFNLTQVLHRSLKILIDPSTPAPKKKSEQPNRCITFQINFFCNSQYVAGGFGSDENGDWVDLSEDESLDGIATHIQDAVLLLHHTHILHCTQTSPVQVLIVLTYEHNAWIHTS